MARYVRLRELLVGVEGLALLRHLYDGDENAADRRLAEVNGLLADERLSRGEATTEAAPRVGYRSWSLSYDNPGNPIIALEQPAVWRLTDAVEPGRALDAGCGTGRHARHLVQRGHYVLGIDLTPEMLGRAATNVPQARFVEADLNEIPAPDDHFDLVVCGLVLGHVENLGPAVTELARVLRPGGRLVISVLHPIQAHLGWHAPFADEGGQRGFVREHAHKHGDYLAEFRAAGLEVRDCVEPELDESHASCKRRAFEHIPEATIAAYAGLPGVLVWALDKRSDSGPSS
jgi:SAM-dependent methyltransferase